MLLLEYDCSRLAVTCDQPADIERPPPFAPSTVASEEKQALQAGGDCLTIPSAPGLRTLQRPYPDAQGDVMHGQIYGEELGNTL